jgi:hypothetical protein
MTRYNIEETAVYDKYVRWCGRTGPRGPSYPILFFLYMHNRQARTPGANACPTLIQPQTGLNRFACWCFLCGYFQLIRSRRNMTWATWCLPCQA